MLTFIVNGPKARSKLRSVADTTSQASPAALAMRTSCNVPETPTPGVDAEALNVNANPEAPAPNWGSVTANWVRLNVPVTVNKPTRSIEALPDTLSDTPPWKSSPLKVIPDGVNAAATVPVVQFAGLTERRLVEHEAAVADLHATARRRDRS